MKPGDSVNHYSPYVDTLEELALKGDLRPRTRIAAALDGEAYRELRRVVDLPVRRSFGAFFTGSKLAAKLLSRGNDADFHHDPSCGVGDLLLAAARRLPIEKTLDATLRSWSKKLIGRDVQPEFVRAAKARLVLLARVRGRFVQSLPRRIFEESFSYITVGDGLSPCAVPQKPGIIVMNPPYSIVSATVKSEWSNGKLNQAALFVDHYASNSPAGTRLLAILPEVLRTGSSYHKWRDHIGRQAATLRVKPWGLFDSHADVDVFVLDFVKADSRKEPKRRWPAVRRRQSNLKDLFDVSVGSVVPHRDPEEGSLRRFITSRTAPAFGTVKRLTSKRRFSGTAVKPPFVVIKRTSRPGDKFRAVATVVLGREKVAVENHLIVCVPKDLKAATCRLLLKQLKNAAVSDWLDSAMCCRHLTVESVRLIPLL